MAAQGTIEHSSARMPQHTWPELDADGARHLVVDSQAGGPVGYDLVFVDGATGLPGFAVGSPLDAVDDEPAGYGC